MSTGEMREQIFDFLKNELVGPDPIPPLVQENGEEILVNEPPRMRYSAGILFPKSASISDVDTVDEVEKNALELVQDSSEQNNMEVDIEGEKEYIPKGDDTDSDGNEDVINLSNDFLPSALGLSTFVDIPESGLIFDIKAGRYISEKYEYIDKKGKTKKAKKFLRQKLDTQILIPKSGFPTTEKRTKVYEIKKDEISTGLILNITNRSIRPEEGLNGCLFTFTLINNKECGDKHRIENEDCFFQVGFSAIQAEGIACFLSYPQKKSTADSEDAASIRLLYRNHRSFAIGHGCATSWEESEEGRAREIRTEVLPKYEIKAIQPSAFEDLKLEMYEMSDVGNFQRTIETLEYLCQKYEHWITEQEKEKVKALDTEELRATANRHISNCKKCLTRMIDGVDLIKSSPRVARAFRLMNRAMLLQQLRYGLKLREWKSNGDNDLFLENITYPSIHKRETWPDWPEQRYGSWRPFQIAFILMNLKSMEKPEESDGEREIVDLIWFPTGGGKTEAYLGLTAFTIFLKRLRDKTDSGTTVLMRYTLRLLTAQQYERAASLICACEIIRRENEGELGTDRITIGLWAGETLTPNKMQDAIKEFNKMIRGESRDNPFIIVKCPWCGAQMGLIYNNKKIEIKGYKKKSGPSRIEFECHNEDCEFSKKDFNLPLLVIDEAIYDSPPTLIIGTVDKFAMLPWRQKARSLFGFRGNNRVSPPELIIQDELHLISGPLGSMVGHYETLIFELCTKHGGVNDIKPKIVASTATISRAKEQGHALYCCGKDNVFQFPPQCIDAGESFFAYEDKKAKGRMYIGVHASGLPSHATAQIRVVASLLQGTKSAEVANESERNYYWTVLNYFNSLRELGHAATLIRADIPEYLNAMCVRKGIVKKDEDDPRRYINRAIELTSRISSSEIPEHLHSLAVDYPSEEQGQLSVDICLATNMISVGVDISRLGLMTVIGQPKTTSEYIQATSRVGRSKSGPGLVITIYNTSKPRDRSHYEHFVSYHSKIYSHVEPTSVTPFSAPVRERALHALLVGLVRFLGEYNQESPQPFPDDEVLDNIREVIENRVSKVDTDELALTMKLLEDKIDEWDRYFPPKYGDFSPPTPELPLMYPAGSTPHDEWNGKSWPTPSSMRNVDADCEASIIGFYGIPGEDE